MKKDKEKDELRVKYQGSDFPHGMVRGKYANQLPEWQKRELDKRYQAYKAGDQNLHDWQSVHERIKKVN
jgi:Putative addiction module component